MRRKDKQVTDLEVISGIINNSQVCRLGLAKDNVPYVVPVSFGYDHDAIFFHTAKNGRKIEYFEANNRVCFEFEDRVQVLADETVPCQWSFSFRSVIGFGTVCELVDEGEKRDGLNRIMQEYSGREWPIDPKRMQGVRVWKIVIESMTGKQSKDQFS
jgi:nitroimidazol reductase NimA-like FMN-containing flavoprotein (pyridoxamine 5'-phosphate oxidase superfamily)